MVKLRDLIKHLKGILISSGRRPLCVILCMLILAIILYGPPDTDTGPPDGDKVRLNASVEEMVISDDKYELTVSDVVTESGEKYCDRLKLYSSNNKYSKREDEPLPDLKIGNTISFFGTVKSFRNPGNPGQFNEASYYRSMGLDARFFVSKIKVIDDKYDRIATALYEIRGLFRDAFYELLPKKEAGIITAMVLGEKQGLDEDVKELYRENGIAHILAISGLHISMIGFGLFKLLRKTVLALKPTAVVTAMMLFLYGQLTGFPLATRRAFIMTVIYLIGKIIGERFDRLNALAFAAIIELILHPMSLYQSGFLLSYGTILGIILFVSEFNQMKVGDEKSIRRMIFNVISGSLGVSLITLPIMVQSYHEIPVFSVIVNTALLPLMSLLLGMSLLGGFVWIVISAISKFVFGIVYYILITYQVVCEVVSSLPYHSMIISHRSTLSIVIYYLVLITMSQFDYCFFTRKERIRSTPRSGRNNLTASDADSDTREDTSFPQDESGCAVCEVFSLSGAQATSEQRSNRVNPTVKLIILIINVLVFLLPSRQPGLTIINMDVGQGDCACIICDDKTVLIDGGSSDVKEVAKYRIVPYLKYMGIDTIDYMIITHSDADHINGFEEILNKDDHFGLLINNVVIPDISGIDTAYTKFESEAKTANGVENVIRISSGDMIRLSDMTLKCLHPDRAYAWEDSNDYSTVLELNYGDFKGLFTGDLGFHGEEAINERLEDVDYLKVGHHGSKGSSSLTFLRRVKPEIAVASAGINNRYHHPAKEAVERITDCGATLYCTKDDGAVTTWTDGERISVEKYLANER